MGRLAFSHPGKLGDSLYALPTMRYMCDSKKTTCDFYTSNYCLPFKRLFEYQHFVDHVYVPENYQVTRMDMGVQPWYIPIDGNLYDIVWQLGFRQVPDRPLPDFIAMVAGVQEPDKIEIKYEYPNIATLDEPYIVMSARGHTGFESLFLEVVEKSPIKVVFIGGWGEEIGNFGDKAVNVCGLDMLETTTWIAKSQGFVGLMSAMLVLANGFDLPKVAPHDGKSWNMRHVIQSPTNFYPVWPTAEDVLGLLK